MPIPRIENGIEYVDCETADEFLDYLQIRKSHWLPDSATSSSWIFRGHADANWSLIPSVMRKLDKMPTLSQRFFYSIKTQLSRSSSMREIRNKVSAKLYDGEICNRKNKYNNEIRLILQMLTEVEVVRQFAALVNQIGLSIPDKEAWELRQDEWDLTRLERYIGDAIDNGNFNLPITVEFALAQHHGIPTRLLDWTDLPFVAAYMAAESTLTQPKNRRPLKIAVWAINAIRLIDHPRVAANKVSRDVSTGNLVKVKLDTNHDIVILRPKLSNNTYLYRQQGLFMYDSNANSFFLEHGRWQPIDEIISSFALNVYGQVVICRKIILPSSEVGELLRLLSSEHITRAHLMPSLDNVITTLDMRDQIKSYEIK